MKEIIKTSKGRFVVVEVLNNVVFCLKFNYYGKDKYEAMFDNSDNNFSYEKCYKLSEISEEEASSIIGWEISKTAKYNKKQLHSLLESQGIEITNNTYIFKV